MTTHPPSGPKSTRLLGPCKMNLIVTPRCQIPNRRKKNIFPSAISSLYKLTNEPRKENRIRQLLYSSTVKNPITINKNSTATDIFLFSFPGNDLVGNRNSVRLNVQEN